MFSPREPKTTSQASDAGFDATDGGWDPYVAALMSGETTAEPSAPDEEDDEPVMSFASTEARRGR